MRTSFRLVLAAVFVLVLAIGGWVVVLGGVPWTAMPGASGTIAVSGNVDTEIEARRNELEQRISDARHAGTLRGLAYMSLLDQQHRLLVKQRRLEAQGITAGARADMMADLDKASRNIDDKIGK